MKIKNQALKLLIGAVFIVGSTACFSDFNLHTMANKRTIWLSDSSNIPSFEELLNRIDKLNSEIKELYGKIADVDAQKYNCEDEDGVIEVLKVQLIAKITKKINLLKRIIRDISLGNLEQDIDDEKLDSYKPQLDRMFQKKENLIKSLIDQLERDSKEQNNSNNIADFVQRDNNVKSLEDLKLDGYKLDLSLLEIEKQLYDSEKDSIYACEMAEIFNDNQDYCYDLDGIMCAIKDEEIICDDKEAVLEILKDVKEETIDIRSLKKELKMSLKGVEGEDALIKNFNNFNKKIKQLQLAFSKAESNYESNKYDDTNCKSNKYDDPKSVLKYMARLLVNALNNKKRVLNQTISKVESDKIECDNKINVLKYLRKEVCNVLEDILVFTDRFVNIISNFSRVSNSRYSDYNVSESEIKYLSLYQTKLMVLKEQNENDMNYDVYKFDFTEEDLAEEQRLIEILKKKKKLGKFNNKKLKELVEKLDF